MGIAVTNSGDVVLQGEDAERYVRLANAECRLYALAAQYKKACAEHEAALLQLRAMARKSVAGELIE